MQCEDEDSCISSSLSSATTSTRSSDWRNAYSEIKKEMELIKRDEEVIKIAKEESELKPCQIPSDELTQVWVKVENTKYLSLMKGNVVIYNTNSCLLLYDLTTHQRFIYSPQPIEKNNGVGCHTGHSNLNILAVSEVALQPYIYIVEYPTMETIDKVSENTPGNYEAIVFSGQKMLISLKSNIKLQISIWDWKSKVKYFNLERDSFSSSMSLRGASDSYVFSLLCLGISPKLYLWELGLFTDIVSLFSKHCSEEKSLELRDQTLLNSNHYAVDSRGDVYKAHKESSDHLYYVKIIENNRENQENNHTVDNYPIIVATASGGLAVYGPDLSIKYYKKLPGNWVCERVQQLEAPLQHLVASTQDNFLIGWDKQKGLIKIGQEITAVEDRRILTQHIDSIAVVQPEGKVIATLLDRRIIKFWTLDQGYFISEFEFNEEVKNMLTHSTVPYIAILSSTIGDISIIDLSHTKRPRLLKVIRVTFEPLACMELTPKGDFLIASGTNKESIHLITADPSKNFDVIRIAITRHEFTSFAVTLSASGQQYLVLLLSYYRNGTNKYCELLTIPNLGEFIKVDLGQSYSNLYTCFTKPNIILATSNQDTSITTLLIDTKKGKLGAKPVLPRYHVVPTLGISQDMFHCVSYGMKDGYIVLYPPFSHKNQNAEPRIYAPHRFNGIRWAEFASKARSFLTLANDYSLTCFLLKAPCGHKEEYSEHIFKFTPYKPIVRDKSKMLFKKLAIEDVPWDEIEENQKKILIYKKGVVRHIGKSIPPETLIQLLNTETAENKIKQLEEVKEQFDADIVVTYIKKWIDHFRTIAKKFVEYNEYLENERPAEMIPWEKIKKVEERAYQEYRKNYEQSLSKFKNTVESSIDRWTKAYNRIIETTWNSMEKQPSSIKMIFRDFACMNFGFNKGYTKVIEKMTDRMNRTYMDYFLHPAIENFTWDARFEVIQEYWTQYYNYLKESVESDQYLPIAKKSDDDMFKEESSGDSQSRYGYDMDESDLDTRSFTRKTTRLKSYTSVQRLGGTLKKTIDSGSTKKEFSDKTLERPIVESDESLFHDSEEESLFKKPRALKRYRKYKKKRLKKLQFEYPYLDEFSISDFHDIFTIPSDFPEDCVFLQPGTLLPSSKKEESTKNASVNDMWSDPSNQIIQQELQKKKSDTKSVDSVEEIDPESKQIEELEKLLMLPPSEKIIIAKQFVDSENEAAMIAAEQAAKLSKKTKKGKKEKVIVMESTEEDEEDTIAEVTEKTVENRRKRIIKKLIEKNTDKLKIITVDEELLKTESKKPTDKVVLGDLTRLYLMLEVDVLIESNRKKRKRRKSSLEREAMNTFKFQEAESKNERMERLLNYAIQSKHVSKSSELLIKSTIIDDYEISESEELSEEEDIGKNKNFLHEAPLDIDKDIIQRVIVVGDIVRLKKRRWLLGHVIQRSAQEKLDADLIKLGIEGPTLPPDFVIAKRREIIEKLKDETQVEKIEQDIKIEEESEEQEYEEKQSEPEVDLELLCWYESAVKKFEDEKNKKVAQQAPPGVDFQDVEASVLDQDDGVLSIKTKMSVLSTLKGIVDDEKPTQDRDASKEKPRLLATANITSVEEGMDYLFEGTTANNYIQLSQYARKQLSVPTTLNMITEIAHNTKYIFDIYMLYNKHFTKLRKIKEKLMESIQKHQENYMYYINEIVEACKETPDFPVMPPAIWSPKENPEMMISVTDDEVPVSRYYSPSELSLLRRQAEEEALRRRLPKPDPFRLEALQIMMDGVVERRWEDELKKEIPYPKALIGKEPEEWEPDEIALNIKYEEDVKFHNSERQRYKKILIENIDKEVEDIRELHLSFDLRVKQMTDKLCEFIQISKELKMLTNRRFKEKSFQLNFLRAAEKARTFTEATKASVDQIESLVKALGKKMKSHKVMMTSLKKKKEQREDKTEDTLKKMSVVTSDRQFVIMNYIRPSFVINQKYFDTANLLNNVLDRYDNFGNCAEEETPIMTEFFRDVSNSLKRNVPQKLTKQIWDVLAQVRKDNIKNDIEIAIFQQEYNKAEDAAKFFKSYLKQKQSFTEMISKALEASVQRFRSAQLLQEYQLVIPMGMIEIDVGGEQEYSDLILMPAVDYSKLLKERHKGMVGLSRQQWKNNVTLNNIEKLSYRHYELIARNKMLSLNIKHIERYQPSKHSRSLVRELKESGIKLGDEETNKRSSVSVAAENVSSVKKEEGHEIVDGDAPVQLDTGTHFILSDAQKHEEDYPSSDGDQYKNAVMESPLPNKNAVTIQIPKDVKDDLLDAKPINFLYDENYAYKEVVSRTASILSTVSRTYKKKRKMLSTTSFISQYSDNKKQGSATRRIVDKRQDSVTNAVRKKGKGRKPRIRSVKKIEKSDSESSLLRKRLSALRINLINTHIGYISNENKKSWKHFINNMDEMIKLYTWRGPNLQSLPLSFKDIVNIEISDEIKEIQTDKFEHIKANLVQEAKMNIEKNTEIWYPKVSAEDAEFFKKDTGIDFEKYLQVPKIVNELYGIDTLVEESQETTEIVPNAPPDNPELNYIEKRKRDFVFTGSWPERLIALWKELEGADHATKQLQKLIKRNKNPTTTDYWNYSDFNFKKHMKSNLVSLLNSYKNQIERFWQESRNMEKEMTRYIEMNKKCVLLFFNYEISQGLTKEVKAKMEEMSRREVCMLIKRNKKVEKAMKKAQLLREIQKNQYEILQLQSELELIQLKTYPILTYKHT